MEIRKLEINIEQYGKPDELSDEEQKLLREALYAVDGSYAPYSEFHVGAAVLLENGIVVKGGNQENSAYPSGLCAERVALFYANSQYPGVAVKAIAITAKADHFVIEAKMLIKSLGTNRNFTLASPMVVKKIGNWELK